MNLIQNPETISSPKAAVTIRQATVEFAGGRRAGDRVKAVDNVDLDVISGERLALVGQSGCGKTTLLRVIAGLQQLSSGRCEHPGRGSTSFVFQQPALLPWRRVIDNVSLPLELQNRKHAGAAAKDAAGAALDEVELRDVASRFPYQLSGGMKMRVSIARALVTRPDLLLLDEPFAALDDLLRTQLGGLVTRLWRLHHFTIVLVTHNIAEAIALSDRVCVMHNGQINAVLDNPVARSGDETESVDEVDVRRTPEFAAFYGVVSDRLREAAGR
ncbi:ABC transporter ATP-binding protein [Aporhodopirellula aestuarii]|uniref:ATP-binding cassette domain-containing protein n=1 Tax=Aporhodopirellula aestuarii TaxID=2950107 RepID=A0ABT0U325_9BACT|nr:ATP-binding cassette domain-containing protein [Aporhodopirellula aestuarii]MCM2371296.1 ATP-binding cassette domain-containing protein [Aporhodopirellula aestuarii]